MQRRANFDADVRERSLFSLSKAGKFSDHAIANRSLGHTSSESIQNLGNTFWFVFSEGTNLLNCNASHRSIFVSLRCIAQYIDCGCSPDAPEGFQDGSAYSSIRIASWPNCKRTEHRNRPFSAHFRQRTSHGTLKRRSRLLSKRTEHLLLHAWREPRWPRMRHSTPRAYGSASSHTHPENLLRCSLRSFAQ